MPASTALQYKERSNATTNGHLEGSGHLRRDNGRLCGMHERSPATAPRRRCPVRRPPSETEPTLRIIEANGIKMRIAEMGKGPLVLFLHGFPESWYSWRHQLPALAKAGYRAVAPDLRGYGKSDKPPAVEDYDIRHLAADAVGVLDALGEKTAVLVGHDWGSIVAWNTIMMYPDRFTALVPMSVPYSGRPPVSPLETMKKAVGDNFFYIVYFQEPGAAEAEFDKEPREFLSRIYPAVAADLTPDSPRDPPEIIDPKRAAGGWIPRLRYAETAAALADAKPTSTISSRSSARPASAAG